MLLAIEGEEVEEVDSALEEETKISYKMTNTIFKINTKYVQYFGNKYKICAVFFSSLGTTNMPISLVFDVPKMKISYFLNIYICP